MTRPAPVPLVGGRLDLLILWAKWTRSSPPTFHPVLCHLIDVAIVTRRLWQEVLPPSARRRIASGLDLDEEAAGRWAVFLAGLHDIGKASPAFQLKILERRVRLREAGLPCPPSPEGPHGTIASRVLRELLTERFGLAPDVARDLARVVGGHHGSFPSGKEERNLGEHNVGKGLWADARLAIVDWLAEALDVLRSTPPRALDNATAMLLAGLVSVADWVGSDEHYFPHAVRDAQQVPVLDLGAYISTASAAAERSLKRLGWTGWQPSNESLSFARLFPDITQPRPVQQAAIDLAEQLAGPNLVIVEAPTGEGKTEAAMYLADRWSAALGQRGCYVALPTQATSNQMFGRVRQFLAQRYPQAVVNLQLLHGHAALSAEFAELAKEGDRLFGPQQVWGPDGSDGAPAGVVAAEWFTGRKRGLLAPFGVGTVDQALLAVLQVLHVFVRLFGLGAKTVIVDEVHAYDTYMTTLLRRLLEWLGALGTSVVLLSATLPRSRRDALIEAYTRGAGWSHASGGGHADYPRLTWATAAGQGARTVQTSAQSRKTLQLDWVDGRLPQVPETPYLLGERLQAALAGGGCAAVICNTVSRAQAVYSALKPYFPGTADDGLPELDLLHARFLYEERERREQRVRRRFGKPTSAAGGAEEAEPVRRPHRAVQVSTQIIEQSLDLDFDLMVTDHAPADLLLQRAGRLHRHSRPRPPGLATPRLLICEPDIQIGGVPAFDRGSEAVYDGHVLLRSWLALRGRAVVQAPEDVEALVEAVYDDERACPSDVSEALQRRWAVTRAVQQRDIQDEAREARDRYIKPPWLSESLASLAGEAREEDAPELHPQHQALTRLIEESVPLVCLEGTAERPLLPGEPGEVLRLSAVPSVAVAKRLLGRSVTVADRRVVHALLEQDAPRSWRRSPLLRHHRLLVLDEQGSAHLGTYILRLDPELGVVITSAERGMGNDSSGKL